MFAPGKFQAVAWTGLIGLLLLAMSGCSDSNDPGGGGDLISQQIGPQGGTVRSADGLLTLIFPAGAVTQTQTITIEPISPSQVGGEFSSFNVERAYRLGPEGVVFQQPVTASGPSPAQVNNPDGSFTISMGTLLTSVGGEVQGLDSVRVEEVEGSRVLRGELSHFSPLVFVHPEVALLKITGVPRELPVGGTFTAQVNLATPLVPTGQHAYVDRSVAPVRQLSSPPAGSHQPLTEADVNEYTGTFQYTCDAAGTGRYDIFVVYAVTILELDAQPHVFFAKRDVLCIAPPAPVIVPAGAVSFPYQIEAAALDPANPNTLVAVGFNGRRTIYDITNPGSPRLVDSEDSFCAEGVRALSFADRVTFTLPTYVASSFFGSEGCFNTIPAGQTRTVSYDDIIPGQIRFVPGTMDVLIPVFNGSFLQRRGMTSEPINIPLGPTARCSFGLTISGNTAFAVGQEGIPGTALADCQPGLSIVDLTSYRLEGSLTFGIAPRYVVISPDGRFAYVSDFEADLIHVINISTRTVEESFPVGDGPVGMAFTPDGFLLVTAWNAGTLELYDPDTGLLLTDFDLDGTNPVDVLATEDGAVVVFFGDEELDVGGGLGLFRLAPREELRRASRSAKR